MNTKAKSEPPLQQQIDDLKKVATTRDEAFKKLEQHGSELFAFLERLCEELELKNEGLVIAPRIGGPAGVSVVMTRDFPSRIEAYEWASELVGKL